MFFTIMGVLFLIFLIQVAFKIPALNRHRNNPYHSNDEYVNLDSDNTVSSSDAYDYSASDSSSSFDSYTSSSD